MSIYEIRVTCMRLTRHDLRFRCHTCAANIIEKVELSNLRVLHDSISVFSSLRVTYNIYFTTCTDLGCFRYLRNAYEESTDILLCRHGIVKAGSFTKRTETQHRRNVLRRPILSFSGKKNENMLSCDYEPTRLRDAFTFYRYQA